MCIKKVESYSFDGQLYATEVDAIYAALNKVAMGIVKNHASKPVAGLIEDPAELASLLMRYHDLIVERNPPATTNRDPATGLLPGEMTGSL